MIRRANEVSELPVYDLCVVGSGPSGMTLVAELADAGLSICVIESGIESKTSFADSLRSLDQTGLLVRDSSRERVLGGASATWRGLTALFDDCDYLPRRGFASYGGWPFGPEVLAPYLKRASERYQFPPPELFKASAWASTQPWERLVAKPFVANRRAPNFGQEFRNLFSRLGTDLILDATVLRLDAHEGVVSSAACKTSAGHEFAVQAKTFVVAAGAIENARLLLNSGLGNEHDQVGRYLMDHPKGYRGVIHVQKDLQDMAAYAGTSRGAYYGYLGLRLSDSEQQKLGVLNSYVQLSPYFPWSESRELAAVKSLARMLRSYTIPTLADLLVGVRALPRVLMLMLTRLSYGRAPKPRRLRMRFFLDMEPRAENRVTLSDEYDALGVRKARVHHELNEKDIKSWRALADALGAECARLRLGKLALGDAVPPNEDASHHMGTTRMGHDPRTSVVTADLRLHAVRNLYIAGGSVFPTAGNANPTMMMVALSVRLAEHLRTNVFSAPVSQPVSDSVGAIVVGAGRRVREDIVPALESLDLSPRIFSRSPKLIMGQKHTYDARPLASLSNRDVAMAKLVYVSVPPAQVSGVLAALTAHDCSKLILILPTPAEEDCKPYLRLFAHAYAEEDMAFLPWIPLVERVAGALQHICLDRSAYRYHAVALVRALTGRGAPGVVTSAWKILNTIYLRCGAARVKLVEPRDYAHGRLRFEGQRVVSDRPGPGVEAIEIVKEGEGIALRLGKEVEKLSKAESALFGSLTEGDTVVTRMHDLKRVGLRRLLASALTGVGWSAQDAVIDAHIDKAVRRFPFWYRG